MEEKVGNSPSGGSGQSEAEQPTAKQPVSDSNVTYNTNPGSQPNLPLKKILIIVTIVLFLVGGGFIVYNTLLNGDLQENARETSSITGTSPQINGPGTTRISKTIQEDFEGDVLDESRWTVSIFGSLPEVEQSNGKLRVAVPEGATETSSGMVTLNEGVVGNFELSVDVELVGGSIDSETKVTFHQFNEGWSNSLIMVLKDNVDGTINARAISKINDQQRELASETYPKTAPIKLTMKREGSTATFMVNEEVFTEGAGVYTGEGGVSLHVDSYEPEYPSVISTFDNFRVSFSSL